MAKAEQLDPSDINGRLYKQNALMMDHLEKAKRMPDDERLKLMAAIGKVQQILMTLRKEHKDDGPAAGSAVRRYASAFAAPVHGGGAQPRDTRPAPDDDEWDDEADAEHAEQ